MKTERQWMVTHEWMVKGNRQTEWIEKKGMLIWLAFYFGGLGGGLYLVSLFFNNLWGMLLGFLLAAVLKGLLNLADLGRPARFWRVIVNFKTSWLSRGLVTVIAFTGLSFIQIVVSYLFPDQSVLLLLLRVSSGILAVGVIAYAGFILTSMKGIPFWNLVFLPVMFVTLGVLGGLGLLIIILSSSQAADVSSIAVVNLGFLISNLLLLLIYLLFAVEEKAGRLSVLYQIKGTLAMTFWGAVALSGIALAVNLLCLSLKIPGIVLVGGMAGEILSCLLMTYCALKSAYYTPIRPQRETES
jgi:formate-dependent nitrite reductase membrane component NrfD